MASSNKTTNKSVTVSSKGMSYEEALAWMAEDEWNTLCIVHYSEYKRAYCIDGGPESLQELELEEFEEEEVAEYELYKHEECPSEYWDTDSEDESEDEEGPEIKLK